MRQDATGGGQVVGTHRLPHPSAMIGAPSTEQEAWRAEEAAQRAPNTVSRTLRCCHLQEESNLFDMVVGQIWVQDQEELSLKK